MREFQGTATAHIEAAPDVIFDVITDINRLPEWNRAIEAVIEEPAIARRGRRTGRGHAPAAAAALEQPLAGRGARS